MADNKKYYYMRLNENYFDSETQVLLESMPDGYLYSNILLKLYLKSLKNDGRLMFNDKIPYSPQMIATITRHQVGTVEKALKIFKDLNIIDLIDSGAIYMLDIQNFIGKSNTEADRKRAYRKRIEEEKGQMSLKCPLEIEKEIELEIEKELKIENNIIIPPGSDCVTKTQLEQEFEIIWKDYPNKKGKANALKAYIKARKKGVTKELIYNGVQDYLNYIEIEKVKPQYIKHGSTWFNNNCWEDDYTIKRKLTTKDIQDKIDFSDF